MTAALRGSHDTIRHSQHSPMPRTKDDQSMAKKVGAPTKSEILTQISKDTELSRRQVSAVFDSLSGTIKRSLRSKGSSPCLAC
jgi:hypothetical protein